MAFRDFRLWTLLQTNEFEQCFTSVHNFECLACWDPFWMWSLSALWGGWPVVRMWSDKVQGVLCKFKLSGSRRLGEFCMFACLLNTYLKLNLHPGCGTSSLPSVKQYCIFKRFPRSPFSIKLAWFYLVFYLCSHHKYKQMRIVLFL